MSELGNADFVPLNRYVALDPAGFNELRVCRTGPLVYNKNDRYIGRGLAKYGEFSFGEQELFRQIVKPGYFVIEVGANIGAHTVLLSQLVGPDGAVFAFEPQRLVFQTLCANLALNQCENVYARQAAVGAKGGTILVPALDPRQPDTSFGSLSLIGANDGDTVPLLTLASLGLPCHFLKVDVEGMEVEVLTGGLRTIQESRPLLYLENDRKERSEELLSLVLGLGYAVFWHTPPLFNPDNFAGDKEDIFPQIASFNVLCIPSELHMEVVGLPQVTDAKDWWRKD
jgi:FkbM family methyltransferase